LGGKFQIAAVGAPEPNSTDTPLAVNTWLRSEIGLITPLVDWLMSIIVGSRYVFGAEESVELALREALSNAMLHGNRLYGSKLVHVRCWCEYGKGMTIVVRDQGHGFDPNAVPDPLAFENPSCRTRARHPFDENCNGRSFFCTRRNGGPYAQGRAETRDTSLALSQRSSKTVCEQTVPWGPCCRVT
jgi:hypothetical protein